MTRSSRKSCLLTVCASLLAACGGGGGGGGNNTGTTPPPQVTYSAKGGVAQKGPLIRGSTVTVQELDNLLVPNGKQYTYQISSDLGTFDPSSAFTSQFLSANATGYYFDEVLNSISGGPVTLNAYADLTADATLGVNLLTTLAYQRINALMKSSQLTFADARARAEGDVLKAFGIPSGDYGRFTALTLSGTGDGDRILAAISALFVYGNTPGTLNALIAAAQQDFADDGQLSSPTVKATLEAAARAIDPAVVAANLTQRFSSLGASFSAADIAAWIDDDGDGVIGKFEFEVSSASAASVFALPASVTSKLVGTAVSVSGGELAINGTPVTSPTNVVAGDVITVSPEAGSFPDGVTTIQVLGNGVPAVATIVPTTGKLLGQSLGSTTISATLGTVNESVPASVTADRFYPGGSLRFEHCAHRASLLQNGKVLVTGGVCSIGADATAETYDPTTNAWTSVAPMNEGRAYHASTLLQDGRVLVTGGAGLGAPWPGVASAEIFNPATGTWSTTAPMSTVRSRHTATLLQDGRVLVAGGGTLSGITNAAEIYDPVAGTWSPAGNLLSQRQLHTAVLLPNGKVLVAGGQTDSQFLDSAEVFDPASNTWAGAGSMSTRRLAHTMTLLQNGKVLVVGGISGQSIQFPTSTELYDPQTNLWTLAANLLSTGRAVHTATLRNDGTVLVVGGTGVTPPLTLRSAERYDPTSNTWVPAGAPMFGRHQHTATLLQSGAVLIVGGSEGKTSAELF